MPRKAIDYSKACIYKICCLDAEIEDIYVGSTTDLVKRRSAHKAACNDPKSKKYDYHAYKFIREQGGWENWEVVLVERFQCDNSEDLFQREREVFDQLKPTLNNRRPKTTVAERKEGNREASKTWREANPERHREIQKAWREANPERQREACKAWAMANPERYRAKQKRWETKRVVCEHCNKEVSQSGFKTHQRTKRCLAIQDADL